MQNRGSSQAATMDRRRFMKLSAGLVCGLSSARAVSAKRAKKIHSNGHNEQLFDLEKDADEWNNMATRADCASIREELKRCILSRFDPDQIERQLRDSLKRRLFLMKAMTKTVRTGPSTPMKHNDEDTCTASGRRVALSSFGPRFDIQIGLY
jgi:hypothetical protein